MQGLIRAGVGAVLLVLAACAQPADLVILGARLHTMDASAGAEDTGGSVAQALCVRDGEITYVGDDAGARACVGDSTRVIEANGALVLPGLIDSHSHIFGGSFADQGVNLSLADTLPLLRAGLVQLREANPGDGVVYARGWQNHIFPPEGPRSALLDEIFGDRVVILESVDGHSTWFSTAALREGGANARTPDPAPGVSFFERDRRTGALLGTAREGAGAFIVERLVSVDPAPYEAALLRWLPHAARAGLTGVFDAGMGAPTEEDAYSTLAQLEQANTLTLRVFASTGDRGPEDDPVARLVALRTQYTGPLLRPYAVKLFADGVPEAHTAFLTHDYHDRAGFRGEPMTPPDLMNARLRAAQAAGVPVHIHAIGGAAVTMSLNAIEQAQTQAERPDLRHAIAHMDFVERADISRFAALGVVAQTSIQWATRDPSYDNIGAFVGMDLMEGAYPVRDLIAAGVVQSFGADWPASAYLSTYEPLTLIEIAVTRRLPGQADAPPRNPGQSLSVAQALNAMTRASAYQLGEEARLGSLEVGKRADIIMLDRDIFTVPAHTIHEASSVLTIVDGRVVYETD